MSIYWQRNLLQTGADAGALAGATYLGNLRFTGNNPACGYATSAQNAACTYALANGVAQGEIQSIVPAADSKSITITLQRMVPARFARLLGFSQFTVNALATAGLLALQSANNLAPVGLDYQTPYVYGQSIVMHDGNCGPGCWGGLRMQSAGGGSGGANVFRQNLAQGCDCTITVGEMLENEPGAKVGAIQQGVAIRINAGESADPSGTWDEHSPDDARAAIVALVDWTGCAGACSVPVKGFAEVWITGTSGADINAVFIRQVSAGSVSSTVTDSGAVRAVLLS